MTKSDAQNHCVNSTVTVFAANLYHQALAVAVVGNTVFLIAGIQLCNQTSARAHRSYNCHLVNPLERASVHALCSVVLKKVLVVNVHHYRVLTRGAFIVNEGSQVDLLGG